MKHRASAFVLFGLLLVVGCGFHPSFTDPETAGLDYALQGEYASPVAGAQVIALGEGAFRAVNYAGGLPGAGWDGRPPVLASGQRDGDIVVFEDGSAIADGLLRSGTKVLQRVERVSPTMGAPAPPGASTAFDTENDDAGLLAAGATSVDRFQDVRLHVEFRTPFMPTAEEQARGNSGVYLQNRYEVQILDSFGLSGEWNECGGLYKVRKPTVNMAFPPLAWQTYDIDFRAARFDGDGDKLSDAQITVRHNGVVIHEDVTLPGTTGGGDPEGPDPGPVYLQDHWDPVFFRNVWVLPTGP
jgi:hypothetical protein